MRENSSLKARRLLTEGRVVVCEARGRHIEAIVRGDSGTHYPVTHTHGTWTCPCEARKVCSHIQAVMLCTAPVRLLKGTRP